MKIAFRAAAYAALFTFSTAAIAGDKWAVQPVQTGDESVRYQKGVPTVDLELNEGVVQITPLPLDHGSLSFGIAVYNDSRRTANMGIENITVQFGTAPVKVFTREDLEKKAKNRAMWASIGLAVAGGIAAGAAASQRDTYQGTMYTPRGTYHSYWSGPSAAGQVQAAALTAGTVYGIASINNRLDNTLQALGDEVIQLTTVDPGHSYAGRIVIDKIRPKTLPAQVTLSINWNGETYPFTFQIAKPGTAAPVFADRERKSDLIDFGAASPATPSEPSAAALAAEVGGDANMMASKADSKPVTEASTDVADASAGTGSNASAVEPVAATPAVAVAAAASPEPSAIVAPKSDAPADVTTAQADSVPSDTTSKANAANTASPKQRRYRRTRRH